ncbi:hypothetical protein HYPSUDRAFT_51948 [Hypholoma sublateritium FD-334 SS-4]|uniref:Uncharacterized protein n=1 Tax=Hypholoma sublateritium (strain FD-334 SS-4) TaxID=945553 RepID=A0A0D2PFR9_HYPSF|nr:hypothetical protein HYPSUDRAFT_51948 [Hypholoma sublateritium FD-334 SS-4]
MSASIARGGKKILNVTDRNDAIALGWLRDYLKSDAERPTWAYYADAIIAANAQPQPRVPQKAKINIFLQQWQPTQKKLPKILQKMLATAKKYQVKIATPEITPDQANQMPIWFHHATGTTLNNKNNYFYSKILRDKHNIFFKDSQQTTKKAIDVNVKHAYKIGS